MRERSPDAGNLLFNHHVRQTVVVLGQNESVDDRFSDLRRRCGLTNTSNTVTVMLETHG